MIPTAPIRIGITLTKEIPDLLFSVLHRCSLLFFPFSSLRIFCPLPRQYHSDEMCVFPCILAQCLSVGVDQFSSFWNCFVFQNILGRMINVKLLT